MVPFWRVRILAAGIGEPVGTFIALEGVEVVLMVGGFGVGVFDHEGVFSNLNALISKSGIAICVPH